MGPNNNLFDKVLVAALMYTHSTCRDLSLHGNRWRCDCGLRDLHSWLRNLSVPYSRSPACHSPPRLASEDIAALPRDELACAPEVSARRSSVETIEGKNISIVCTIKVSVASSVFGPPPQ